MVVVQLFGLACLFDCWVVKVDLCVWFVRFPSNSVGSLQLLYYNPKTCIWDLNETQSLKKSCLVVPWNSSLCKTAPHRTATHWQQRQVAITSVRLDCLLQAASQIWLYKMCRVLAKCMHAKKKELKSNYVCFTEIVQLQINCGCILCFWNSTIYNYTHFNPVILDLFGPKT